MKHQILAQYREQIDLYRDFTQQLLTLVADLLKAEGIRIHSLTARTKEEDSLEEKIAKNPGKYFCLEDITDIAGLRITTYFEDDVDRVAAIIQREFYIDELNSIDKRLLIDPDRFGYLSLHYVASLAASRYALPEYEKFKDCKVEFQIRSILQHAWAEIEHDLGYKYQFSIPREIRRSFSRLAGLLEIADQEFRNIRTSLADYEQDIARRISDAPEKVFLDRVSLSAFLERSLIVDELNRDILSVKTSYEIYPAYQLDSFISQLHFFQIESIAQLEKALRENRSSILSLAHSFLKKDSNTAADEFTELPNTISIFYLCYALIGKKGSVASALAFLSEYSIGNATERESLAHYLIEFQLE
ncbi:hypothetical protein [Azotosporobacter soli]|uniref:GTP pyrophosphokinase n=1 Tax=Azotosporobacter soli TaxID=3055040 RepID=UPI0031FF3635